MTHLAVAAVMIAWSVTSGSVTGDPKSLEVPAAEREKARALVRRLGSADFRERDEATKRLRAMGRLALPVLTAAAAADPDAEVRFRCEGLIPAAAAADFDARLVVFLADAQGKHEHELPGWAEFREMTGEDPLARELFAELLRSEPNRHLIAGLAEGKAEMERRVIARRQDLYWQMNPQRLGVPDPPPRYEPTLLDAAGLLFCEALSGDKLTPRGALRMVTPYTLLIRPSVRNDLATDRFGPVVQKLVVAWMDTRTTATSLTQVMTLASRYGVEDATRFAARMIRAPGATAVQRAQAASAIAKDGRKDDLPVLVTLMTDETVVRARPQGLDIQLRDVALAMAALLAGRDPADFRLEYQSAGFADKYSYWNHAFPDEEARKAGFAEWAKVEPELVTKK
jgi:hypothetical protein